MWRRWRRGKARPTGAPPTSSTCGQLVQAIDRWVATRGARLVLIDDVGARAVMTAQWLMQMGWDAVVLDRPFEGAGVSGAPPAGGPQALPRVMAISVTEAAHWLDGGAAAIVIG